MKVEKSRQAGFCSGVRRAIELMHQAARELGAVETLGPVVHNEQVLEELARCGVKTVESLEEVKGKTAVISAHGVSPRVEEEMRARGLQVIDTTCPFVHRAQMAARKLAKAGFFVVVYGEREHAEVKGILGWAGGKGMATLDEKEVARLPDLPRRMGVVAQTTQVPSLFYEFVKKLFDSVFRRNSEFWVRDTICHETRSRQEATAELAGRVDLMLVIGSRTSANTRRLAELAEGHTETHLVASAEEIDPAWLKGKSRIGVTAGASTSDKTIREVVERLEGMT